MDNAIDIAMNAYRASDAFAEASHTDWQDEPEAAKLIAEAALLNDRYGDGDNSVYPRLEAIDAELEAIRDDFISDNAPLTSDGDYDQFWIEELICVQSAIEAKMPAQVAA